MSLEIPNFLCSRVLWRSGVLRIIRNLRFHVFCSFCAEGHNKRALAVTSSWEVTATARESTAAEDDEGAVAGSATVAPGGDFILTKHPIFHSMV